MLKVSEQDLMQAYNILNQIIMCGIDITPPQSDPERLEPMLTAFGRFKSDAKDNNISYQEVYTIAGQCDALLELDEEQVNQRIDAIKKSAVAFKKSVNALYNYIQSTKPIDFDAIVSDVRNEYADKKATGSENSGFLTD